MDSVTPQIENAPEAFQVWEGWVEVEKEYRGIALSLLHHFGEWLFATYPEIEAVVVTEQHPGGIECLIYVQPAYAEIVQKALDGYGRVLLKQLPLNRFATEEATLMRLKQRLDISALEVKVSKDMGRKHDADPLSVDEIELDIQAIHQSVGNACIEMATTDEVN